MAFLGAIKEQRTKDKCKRTTFVLNNCPSLFRPGVKTTFAPLKPKIFVPPSATVWTFKCPSVVFTPTVEIENFPAFTKYYYTNAVLGQDARGSYLEREEDTSWINTNIINTGTQSLGEILVDEGAGYIFVQAVPFPAQPYELRRYPLTGGASYTVIIQNTALLNGVSALDINRRDKRIYVMSFDVFGEGAIYEFDYSGTLQRTIISWPTVFNMAGCGFDKASHIYYELYIPTFSKYLRRVNISTLDDEQLLLDITSNNPVTIRANKSKGYLVHRHYGTRDIRTLTIPTIGSYNTISSGGAVGQTSLAVDWADLQVYYDHAGLNRIPITGGTPTLITGHLTPSTGSDLGV